MYIIDPPLYFGHLGTEYFYKKAVTYQIDLTSKTLLYPPFDQFTSKQAQILGSLAAIVEGRFSICNDLSILRKLEFV